MPELAPEPLPGTGVRYVLPWRGRMPALSAIAVLCTLFGVLCAGVPVVRVAGRGGLPESVFLLPMVLAGLGLAVFGLFLWFGRTEIDVLDDRVEVRERLGLLRHRRRRPRGGIARLQVVRAEVRQNDRPVPGLATLLALDPAGERFPLVLLHRVEVLQALGNRLARDLGLAAAEVPVVSSRELFARAGLAGTAAARDEVPPQPAGSRAVLERNAAGFLLTLPPLGWRNGNGALLLFGLLFGLAPVAIVLAGATTETGRPVPPWLALPFALVGFGLAFLGVRIARARALLAVAGGALLVSRQTVLGTRRHDLPAAAIERIVVADSGAKVNDRPLRQLQVHLRAGSPLRMLTGRDEAELQWIAAELRRELRL